MSCQHSIMFVFLLDHEIRVHYITAEMLMLFTLTLKFKQ